MAAGTGLPAPARSRSARQRSDQGGFTLIELAVAGALCLVIVLGALGLLQALRRSYVKTELAADAEQRARGALESIVHDLRCAGLGVDPDGAAGRPDEALEGAWAGAIAARGDLDADDPRERDDPETWIAGIFPATRTGNDEVFVYALRREAGGGGSDLVFEADLASSVPVTTPSGERVAPRDGIVETLRLTRIAAGAGGAAGPGYVLYRGSVASNANLWGTGNAVVWQPVADSVSMLGFRYFDESGIEIPPPGGDEAARAERAKIAAVEVRVVALEKRADALWRDPADANPSSAGYRKAEHTLRVALRNTVGMTREDRTLRPAYPP